MFNNAVFKKVASGLGMIALVLLLFKWGEQGLLLVAFVLGHCVVDELFNNFFKLQRKTVPYFVAHLLYSLPFLLVFGLDHKWLMNGVIYGGVILNSALLAYLFLQPMNGPSPFTTIKEKAPWLTGLFVLFPVASLASIFQFAEWRFYLGLLLFVNYSMDTFGWFFGKTFGKKKLWVEVSPNKTFEGLYGGIGGGMLVGALYCYILQDIFSFWAILGFGVLALFAQLGDLFQSKIKRQFEIKDSSDLIPGHGGIYDRIDSLLFVAPFFIVVIQLI